MGPELLVRRRPMMKRKHLQNEWNDDTQGSSVDQNLVRGKPKRADNLQGLHDIVRHGRCKRGQTGPVPYVAYDSVQWFLLFKRNNQRWKIT